MNHRRLRACTALLCLAVALPSGCVRRERPAPPEEPRPIAVSLPVPPARGIPPVQPGLVTELERRGLEATQVKGGVLVYLPAVYQFAFDRSTIEAKTRAVLRDLATLLLDDLHAGRRIIVEGHADAIGDTDYNRELSSRRAEAVIVELVAAGVPRARLAKRALGEANPVAPNTHADGRDNPEGRAKNRRVALLIQDPS